jgi:hypothetical protein
VLLILILVVVTWSVATPWVSSPLSGGNVPMSSLSYNYIVVVLNFRLYYKALLLITKDPI